MAVFSGYVVSIQPTAIRVGYPIDLLVKWTVSTSSAWEVINGWWADIKLSLGGMEASHESGMIIGYSTQVFSHMLNVGPDVMPGYDLYGYATITCWKGGFSGYYEIVYYEPITIQVTGIPDGNGGNGEPPSGELPLIPIAIGAGVLLVAVAAFTRKKR